MGPHLAASPAQWNELLQLLATAGLSDRHQQLAEIVRCGIALRSRELRREDLELGVSRLGGEPDLARGSLWPTAEGEPLRFIVQVNLAELAAFDVDKLLPENGLLSMFADRWGREVRVVHAHDLAELERRSAPREEPHPIRLCGFDLAAELQLPPPESEFFNASAFARDEEAAERYWDEIWLLWLERRRPGAAGTPGVHQLLGYCNAENQEEQSAGEQVLFGIDSDDRANLQWGDVHCLWVLQQHEALAQRRWASLRAAM
jgi:hypothetical protein